jgi:hypothetical protein
MQRDVASGVLLLSGAIAGLLIMLLHPTGAEVGAATPGHGMELLNRLVHGFALAVTPAVFLGLLGFARAMGPSKLSTAALVAWGYGAVAVMSAAVASGFVTPATMHGTATPEAFAHYSYLWNQGYATVNVAASGAAMILFGLAMLGSPARLRGPAWLGILAGAGLLLGILSGHLRLDIHGFGIVMIAEGIWLAWLAVLLLRTRGLSSSAANS